MTEMPELRLRSPAHPGDFIRHDILEPLALTVTRAAAILGVTRPALSVLLNQRASLSAEMALRLEKAFGVSMETMMRMQNSFDIAQARRKADDIQISRYSPSAAPLA